MVTLGDDIEFANAIDNMVWYFYKAAYDPTKYKTPGPLLHAQVVTIADKNVCPSLYNLAKTSFAKTTKTIELKTGPPLLHFSTNRRQRKY